ncbi:MAG: histidine--tRNA ligase, partial [Culicoidibacterales bacterium]
RYERPQAGRQRQFHQFGIEALGSTNPAIDAEVIALGVDILKRLGLSKYKVLINSLGDDVSRKAYRDALIAHFEPRIAEMCTDCQTRLAKNPLRVLDCKKDRNHELMQSVPEMIDYLSEESLKYFEQVKTYLDILGISYEVDKNMVRGLDYYTETVFEVVSTDDAFGSQATLFGGGRYNRMIEELGGPTMPGIGFGMGIERMMIALDLLNIDIAENNQLDAYVVSFDADDLSEQYVFSVLNTLRQAELKVERDYLGRSSKAQLKSINRYLPRYAIMIGSTEVEKKIITLKNVDSGEQMTCTIDEAIALMKGE